MQIFWSLIPPPPPPAVQSYMETLSTLCSHCSQHNTLSLHKTETNYSDVLSAVERWPECRREASAPICHGSLSPSCQPRQISERCWKLCKHKYTDYFYFINFLLGDWMKKWWPQLAYHGGDKVKQWRTCILVAHGHAPCFCALWFLSPYFEYIRTKKMLKVLICWTETPLEQSSPKSASALQKSV